MRAKTALAGIFVASFILHPFYCDDLLEEADDTDDIRLLKTEERYKYQFIHYICCHLFYILFEYFYSENV